MTTERSREQVIQRAIESRRHEYLVRSATTAAVAIMIVIVCCIEALRDGDVHGWLAGIGAAVVGYYFGAHSATNGHNLPRMARKSDTGDDANGSTR